MENRDAQMQSLQQDMKDFQEETRTRLVELERRSMEAPIPPAVEMRIQTLGKSVLSDKAAPTYA